MLLGIGALIVGSAISGLLVGLVVMLAGKLVLKEAPEFGDAFKACFFAALVGAFVQFILGIAMADASQLLSTGLSMLATYIIYVILFQTIIGYTMGQAMAVAAVAIAVMLAIAISIGVILAGTGAIA